MSHTNKKTTFSSLSLLALGALGVVYGDIGTSPIYAIKEIFFGHGEMVRSEANILGVISLVLWALTIIITVKYVIYVLRADNDGEGGIFALYGLLQKNSGKFIAVIGTLQILAAGLLFGDGVITPAISVISAIEGLTVVTDSFQPYVIPITITILTVLFSVQKYGTAKIGKIFGPIITLWFASIASVGALHLVQNPTILYALNPTYAIQFLMGNNFHSILLVLGSVMLVVTGGEAMYADMGHFGRLPIRLSWFSVTYPALVLNYLGQGAFLLSGKTVIAESIFFSMVPSMFLIPMIILATMATIIASQALITGAFSLATQAMALGLIPYLKAIHTHKDHEGQIYVPVMNWTIYIGCILLVLTFKNSSNLAAAYGLAVSGVELVTTFSMIFIAQKIWKWNLPASLAVFLPLAGIEIMFLSANSLKLFQGGYVPLTIGVSVLFIMKTWAWGRKFVADTYSNVETMSIQDLISVKKTHDIILPKSVVIMSPESIDENTAKVPFLKQLFWERYGAMPKHLVFLTVVFKREPHVSEKKRYEIHPIYSSAKNGTITGVTINFGFMEDANVESVLEGLAKHKQLTIDENPKDWIFHAAHERIYLDHLKGFIQRLRFNFFQFLLRNSQTADEYLGLGKEHKLTIHTVPVYIGR